MSTLETERLQDDTFSNVSTFEIVWKASVFVGVFGHFSMEDRQKRVKIYAFSSENALVWMGP